MYFRIIRNDMAKSRLITLTTMIFVAAAAMLVSLAAILIVQLSGSIDTLMLQAKTPHFMQMHSGEINVSGLTAFAKQNSYVNEFQVLEFLNIEGAQIILDGNSLSDSVQDNGFCTQSKAFDYLIDLDGSTIHVSEGEIYVPIAYLKEGRAAVGGRAVICGREFIIKGFLRDSQMNSPLASSKRFLVHESDFEALRESGKLEYLIEFRLNDVSDLGAFENDYTCAGLEANGPAVTYPLFKMMNAISDGLMIAVILLISVLVVAIAFMCIRFTLLAKIEDDYREIGVMKAIGLHISDIKRIYLVKYAAIALAGSILGYALSFLCKDTLTQNIRLAMGESGDSSLAFALGIIGVLLIFLTIIVYVSSVLRRFKNISAVAAIRFGMSQEHVTKTGRFRLRNRFVPANVFLGIKDVLIRKKLYLTLLLVLVLSSFILLVPQNLYHTIAGKDFTRYMGIGNCDMRIDIQQTDDITAKAAEIVWVMENDEDISRYALLTTKAFTAISAEGEPGRIRVELGDHSVFPVEYITGRAPAAANEIALSVLNADEMGKQENDAMTLIIDGHEEVLTVCGIYSDITNGGKTAKAVFNDASADVMWSIICAELSDDALIGTKAQEYMDWFGYAKVSSINQFVIQTFGATISSVKIASYVAAVVALLMTILITLLFMKMLVAKEKSSLAVLKALGFTGRDITLQYVTRCVLILAFGMLLGTFLANTVGEMLAGMLISTFGASAFRFSVNPVSAYLLSPLMMGFAVLLATILGTWNAGKITIAENIDRS